MKKLFGIWPPVGIHQHEGRAGNRIQCSPALGHTLDKRGFPCSQVALQTDQITLLE